MHAPLAPAWKEGFHTKGFNILTRAMHSAPLYSERPNAPRLWVCTANNSYYCAPGPLDRSIQSPETSMIPPRVGVAGRGPQLQ